MTNRTRIRRVVTYEDRSEHLVGLKLLLLSLHRYHPELPVDAFAPDAPSSLVDWIKRVPSATLHRQPVEGGRGFDVKPILLRRAVERHDGAAMWLDADLMVNGDITELLDAAPPHAIVVTEEPLAMPHQGGTSRSRAWGLSPVRAMRATTNTSVVRVTPDHVRLLSTWHEFLQRPEYLEAQRQPWDARPIHLMGDQEVLCALLESTYADIPVYYLRRGRDIAHCFQHHGYMFHQMVANLVARRQPVFVHSHGYKPWLYPTNHRVHLDVSPYTLTARSYADQLDEAADWMAPSTNSGRRMVRLARNDPWTASLPLAVYKELRHQRLVRTGFKRLLRRE